MINWARFETIYSHVYMCIEQLLCYLLKLLLLDDSDDDDSERLNAMF